MPRRKAKIAVGLVLALGIVCFLFFWVFPRVGGKSEPEWNPVRGTPDSPLSRTEMVATKEDPISGGKNVVWCATLQISWDRLRNDLFGGRLEIQGSKEKSERLNASPFDTGSLDVRDYYVAAGWVKDGIIGKVRDDLSRRFPGESDPLPEASEFAAVSYAFLKIGLKFPIPYFESREPLQFRDGSGRETPVTSFGIRHEDDYAYGSMRRQVMPLYASNDGDGGPQKEFVLDLYDESDPYQLLVARIDFKGTLGETLRDMDERIRTWSSWSRTSNWISLTDSGIWRIR